MQEILPLRNALLDSHKLLLAFERRRYEDVYGKVATPGLMLELVVNHPSFQWLRELSGLIVSMDEALEGKATAVSAEDFRVAVERLYVTPKLGEPFGEKYTVAFQHDADVAQAHGQILSALKRPPSEKS